MAKQETYRGFPVGRRIVTFPKGSWQAAAHANGRRFYEPIPPAPRLERTPPTETLQAEVAASHVAEVIVAALVEEQTVRSAKATNAQEATLIS